jgi:UDP-N-acetylglucosamine--N-acetylmuramyl-(pentapeptide) pyrophosphoryl-undecaprenol N-acetylglucosamine transferase
VIAAGGTAGHVYPGLALAEALRRVRPDSRVTFVGTPRGIESDAVPDAGYPLELIEVTPWSRTLGAKRFLAPASAVSATARARALLRRMAPDVVVGMGGYASLPVVLAARTRGMPTVLHEQNAIPGVANVVGARAARRIAVTFPETRERFPRGIEVRVLGNPLRPQIARLDRDALRPAATGALALDANRRTLLVMGGSLGAARLNDAVVGLAERWRDRGDLQLFVAAGRQHGPELRERLDAATSGGALLVRCVDYLDKVEHAYAAADVALCRAGAATVMELAASGIASILVPYPYARANHQEANARALERTGGADVVLDREATADALAPRLQRLLDDDGARTTMAAAARAFAKPAAADDLASWVLSLADGSGKSGVPRG